MKQDRFAVWLKTLTQFHYRVGLSLFLLVATASAQARKEDDKEEKTKNLIVMITGQLAGQETFGAGIIFGVANDRLYIATANHVVRKGMQTMKNLRVFFKFLPGDSIEAKLANSDKDLDLAVLMIEYLQKQKIPTDKLRWNILADSDILQREDAVYSVGYARGELWATSGKDRIAKADQFELAFFSDFVDPGQSGGGLFNARWKLVGMVKQYEPPYLVAMNFKRILDKLKEWDYPVNLTHTKRPIWKNWRLIGGGIATAGIILYLVFRPEEGFPDPPGRPGI